MALSFLACPCHLPLTLGILATLLGGSTLAVMLRDNALVAGLLVTAIWVAGTARGFLLVRRGQQTGFACTIRPTSPDVGR